MCEQQNTQALFLSKQRENELIQIVILILIAASRKIVIMWLSFNCFSMTHRDVREGTADYEEAERFSGQAKG